MAKKNIVFITSTFNRRKLTINAVNTLAKVCKPALNLSFIIYDSGSTDGTVEELEGLENVTIIRGNCNVFWAEGVKICLEYLSTNSAFSIDGVTFFNDDVLFFEKELRQWLSISLKNIAISKATGAFFVDKNNQISYGGFKKTPFLFKKIEKIQDRKNIDALNFNLAMFPADPIFKNYNDWFAFQHGFADIFTSYKFKANYGSLFLPPIIVGKCEKNSYVDKYKMKSLTRLNALIMLKDPKYLPFFDYYKFLELLQPFRIILITKTYSWLFFKFIFALLFFWRV